VTDHVEPVGRLVSRRLVSEAECVRDGPARLALVQQATAIANGDDELDVAFGVRKSLLAGGRPRPGSNDRPLHARKRKVIRR
jgi:hypothetical protein